MSLGTSSRYSQYLAQSDPQQYQQRIIYDGTYVQAKPTIVHAVFLSAGAAFLVRPPGDLFRGYS